VTSEVAGHPRTSNPTRGPRAQGFRPQALSSDHSIRRDLVVGSDAQEVPAPGSEQAEWRRTERQLPGDEVGLPVPDADSELSASGLERACCP